MDENKMPTNGEAEISENVTEKSFKEKTEEETASESSISVRQTEYVYGWETNDKKQENTAQKAEKGYKGLAIAAFGVSCVALLIAFALFFSVLILRMPSTANGELDPPLVSNVSVSAIADAGYLYTVAIKTETVSATGTLTVGVGTGIIITENGYIATNSHVVSDARSITVHTKNGNTYSGKVISDDPEHDIALIRINPDEGESFVAARIAGIDTVRVGDRVVAIGTPHSIDYAWTVSVGHVSYIGRKMGMSGGKAIEMIQTDTPVNPGNSGGPLINENGEVIGIVSAKLDETYEGINFAIPISKYMDFFEQGIEGDMAKPQLGVTGASVDGGKRYFVKEKTLYSVYNDGDGNGDYIYINYFDKQYLEDEESAQVIEIKKSGFMIMGIVDGSDANGKLQTYDVITEFDGTELIYDDMHDPYDTVVGILATKKASDTVKVKFMRDGTEHEINLSLKEKE